MQLWLTKNNFVDKKLYDGPVVATLGNFDGVHAGHRLLIAKAIESAKDKAIPSVLITFDPHPIKVLSPDSQSRLLMTLPQKLSVLESLGLEGVWVISFSREFSELEPGAFLDVLQKALCPVELHIGHAFRFGWDRAGDISVLQGWGNGIGCKIHVHAYKATDGGALSSSRIRQVLADGDVALASELLVAPFRMTGIIVEGDRRGRSLGFPTANLKWEQECHPASGVYVTVMSCPDHLIPSVQQVERKDHQSFFKREQSTHYQKLAGGGDPSPSYQVDLVRMQPGISKPTLGLTNVGLKPTFGGQCLTIETHLPGIDADLYGARVELDFLHRIRGEEKFENPEVLKRKIYEDIKVGTAWWQLHS